MPLNAYPVLHCNLPGHGGKIIYYSFKIEKRYLNIERYQSEKYSLLQHTIKDIVQRSLIIHFWATGKMFLLLKLYILFQSKNYSNLLQKIKMNQYGVYDNLLCHHARSLTNSFSWKFENVKFIFKPMASFIYFKPKVTKQELTGGKILQSTVLNI